MMETGTMYDHLQALVAWLLAHECKHVAMESTGCYWQPLYNALTEAGILCAVVNARHAKNLPGRKTDWNDAQWIAHLHRHGMLRASFVPDEEQQTLRHYARSLECLVQDRTREVNRVEKLLQQAGFKLSSVLSDIFSNTGRLFLNTLAQNGQITRVDVRNLRDPRCKHTVDEISRALQGSMRSSDCKLLSFKLRQIDTYDKQIQELEAMTNAIIGSYAGAIEILDSIPGIARLAAIEILAEIGRDMSPFHTSEQLASWAGLSPGCNESAGKKSPLIPSMATLTSSVS